MQHDSTAPRALQHGCDDATLLELASAAAHASASNCMDSMFMKLRASHVFAFSSISLFRLAIVAYTLHEQACMPRQHPTSAAASLASHASRATTHQGAGQERRVPEERRERGHRRGGGAGRSLDLPDLRCPAGAVPGASRRHVQAMRRRTPVHRR